ncbi:MAG TPA: GNAT family N-acetyltransferase [Gemmatimonadales bacterium]|nr:GNAT family N-acetyltransferase [Gemmatimonadales bacterium]
MKPPNGLVIRRAEPGDATLLAALARRTFRDAFGAANRPEDLEAHLDAHYTPDEMAAELADPSWCTLLTEVDGQAAGYAQLAAGDPPCEGGPGGIMLSRFYLEQAWVGRGIAGPLLAAVRREALARGARYLWLTVWEQNPRAIAFYRKEGFDEIGETTFTVGSDPQRDLVMRAPL